MTDLFTQLDFTSLKAAYRSRLITPESLVASLYARMERDASPAIWITRVDEAALREQARALGPYRDDLPLYGIPFAVKDNIDVVGLPTTAACPSFAYLPAASSPAVHALVRAGALCLGKVNMDQFATGLVGSRSPYGTPHNVFDPAYLPGGSSSGSAVAVAAHYVSFSLGTDTAGSGRVPAALNNVVGLKPTRGLLPTAGMVPACASLDCLSVFAACVDDAALVRDVVLGMPSRRPGFAASFRFAVPRQLEFDGDAQSKIAFEASIARVSALGGEVVPIDFEPFLELGNLLYGPFVVERKLAVGEFIEAHRREVLPVTAEIILGASRFSASDAFRAFERAAVLREHCRRALAGVDLLVTPTVPTHYTVAADRADPRAINDKLGIYTRFVNFVGGPVLSIPQDFRADGLPFGISLHTLPGRDRELDALADRLHRTSNAGMGRLRHALPLIAADAKRSEPSEARLAVVGAHMRGMALHQQLLDRGARFVATVRTSPKYRLYALPGGEVERPGLVRTVAPGKAIEVELWDLTFRELGELMARVPPPLSIGTVEVEDGELVKGFLCESYASEGATDISEFGGYRAYVSRR